MAEWGAETLILGQAPRLLDLLKTGYQAWHTMGFLFDLLPILAYFPIPGHPFSGILNQTVGVRGFSPLENGAA
jgi:hypothetical protein